MCRYWNLDYATIFAPPESQIKSVSSATALVEKSKVLDDPGYYGTFHGYLYTKNISKPEIVPFDLVIEPQAGSVIAKMITWGKQDNVNGEELPNVTTYTGIPILLTKTQTIFMILTNPDGLSYILYFDYRHYNIARLYYRKGIALTTESSSDKPVLGNFVLFQNTVSQRKFKKYVPGLLSIIGDSFVITDEAMQELAQDLEMASSFQDYDYNWNKKIISGYRVIFEHVLTSINNKYDDAEVLRVMGALLRMTEKSLSPNRIEYDNPPFTKESVEKLRLLYESALEDKMSISGKTVSKRLNEVVKQRFLNNYAFLVFYDDDTKELRRSKILFWSIMLEKVLDKVVDKQEITFGDYMFLYSDYDNIRKKIKELSENTSTYMLLGLEEEEKLEKLKREQTRDEARKVFLGKEYNNEEKQAAYGETNTYINKVLSDLSSPKKGNCLFFLNCSITNVGTFIEQFPQYSQLQINRINVYKTLSKYDLVEDGERVVIPYEKWKEKSEAGYFIHMHRLAGGL